MTNINICFLFPCLLLVLLLIGVILKHKRRDKEEQYGVDEVRYNPDVYPEVAFSDDPFGVNEGEEDVTIHNNIYDSIDNYNVPIFPEGRNHYEVQQHSPLDEGEVQEENTEEEVKASYDTPLPTQQDGEDTTAVPMGYKELDPDTMMEEIDHKYQGTFANKDDDDYDIPLTLGRHLVGMSNTKKPVTEEGYKNVDEDSNVGEGGENVDPGDDNQQPLIIDDDVSDQKTATDEGRQNVGGDEDYQSMKDEDDQVSITDEDATLI